MNARFYFLFGVIIYIFSFIFSYENWVAPKYENWGMGYREVPTGYIIASWILCLIPAFWMPLDLKRPSQLLFFIQYFIIFIPTSFILYHSVKPIFTPEEAFSIVLALFSGVMIFLVIYKFPLFHFKRIALSTKTFWIIFWSGAISLFIYLLTVFGSHFQLAGFQDIYDVRSSSDQIVAAFGGSFAGYSQMWLSGFVLPFLFANGVFRRRWSLVSIAGIGYIYLLGIGGSKATMLAMVYLSAIYFLVRAGGRNAGLKLALCLSGLLLFPTLLTLAGEVGELIHLWYVAIINSRIFVIPQLSIGQYYDFFRSHPLTYGSHITGVNLIISFPYDMDIPRTIGRYFYDAELTSNVNMWAQDGIASFGLIGIPFVSAIAAAVFWTLDSIAKPHDHRFVTVALGNIALSFANVSLFTTIVSGGLLWLIIALHFYKQEY
jgi:hypothetical protein